jgi:hypothetical protein
LEIIGDYLKKDKLYRFEIKNGFEFKNYFIEELIYELKTYKI